MKKIFFLNLILILFLCSITNAEYRTGTSDGDYDTQLISLFNEGLLDSQTYSKPLTNSYYHPMVFDLNNDSVDEIIILDKQTFRIYQNRTLDIVASYSAPCGGPSMSNFDIFDVNGDGDAEIIFACNSPERIYFLNLENSVLTNTSQLSYSTSSHVDGDLMIKCGATNQCILVYPKDGHHAQSNNDLYARGFNYTSMSAELVLDTKDNQPHIWCFPNIVNLEYVDYDLDSSYEWVFSAIYSAQNVDSLYTVYYVRVSDALGIAKEGQFNRSGFVIGDDGLSNCSTLEAGKYLTSPTVSDVGSGTGYETIIAYMIDSDEFNLEMIGSNKQSIDTYPDVLLGDADGTLMSNVIIGDFLGEGNKEFCAFGFAQDELYATLLCGSEYHCHNSLGICYEHIEYVFDTTGYFNLSDIARNYYIMTNALKSSTTVVTSTNIDNAFNPYEIINAYGIFEMNPDDNFGVIEIPPRRSMDLIYASPLGEASLIPNDIENIGFADIIGLKSSNIYYIDDLLVNSPPTILSYEINPCLNSQWKQNTTVLITITPIDSYDDVSARATLYYGSTKNRSSAWYNYTSSGTDFQFYFTANDTISLGTLLLEARDDNNPSDVTSIELSFRVGTNGVVFGDCVTTVDNTTTSNATITNIINPENNGTFVQTVNNTASITGLGTSLTWLLFMGVIAFLVFFLYRDRNTDDKTRGILVVIVEVIMLIMGVSLGFLSFALLLTLLILCIIIGGFWIGIKIFNSTGG